MVKFSPQLCKYKAKSLIMKGPCEPVEGCGRRLAYWKKKKFIVCRRLCENHDLRKLAWFQISVNYILLKRYRLSNFRLEGKELMERFHPLQFVNFGFCRRKLGRGREWCRSEQILLLVGDLQFRTRTISKKKKKFRVFLLTSRILPLPRPI